MTPSEFEQQIILAVIKGSSTLREVDGQMWHQLPTPDEAVRYAKAVVDAHTKIQRDEGYAPPVTVKIDLHWKEKITGKVVHDAIIKNSTNAYVDYDINHESVRAHYEAIAQNIREAIQ